MEHGVCQRACQETANQRETVKETNDNISSQDVSKFTYLTLDKYISDKKCIKVTSYIVSTNCLVWYKYSNCNIYKFTINIFNIIVWEIIFPAVRNNNLKIRSVW